MPFYPKSMLKPRMRRIVRHPDFRAGFRLGFCRDHTTPPSPVRHLIQCMRTDGAGPIEPLSTNSALMSL